MSPPPYRSSFAFSCFRVFAIPFLACSSIVAALDSAYSCAAELDYPVSIAVGASGVVYVADRNLPGVWRLEGERLSVLFQGSKKLRTPLAAVRCVALDSDGKLLAGDSSTRDVYRFDAAGQPRALTATADGLGQIGIPMDIAVNAEGDLLVSDLEGNRVLTIPKEGGRARVFAEVPAPRGLFYDRQRRLWVISGRRLLRLDAPAEPQVVVDDGVFQYPHTVVVRPDGKAYVCDGYARAIWEVVAGRKPRKWVSGPPLDNPVGLALAHDRLLVADSRARAVFEIDLQGKLRRREARPGNP